MNAVLELEPTRHLLTVDDVLRMVEVGIIDEGARIELIEGELIDMAPIGAPHMGKVNRLTKLFVLAFGDDAIVSVQNSVKLSDITLPQPDFTILKAAPDEYQKRMPTVADVVLVVEVSDSTLRYDRRRKMPLYARHGIPEAWIVDVVNERILRFLEPRADGYGREDELHGRVHAQAVPHCAIDLGGLFR